MRTGSIQLARVFGIRIGASPSWFVVALIFIVWLSTAYDDQYGQTTGYLMAVASVVLFFLSLIAARARARAGSPGATGSGSPGIDLWFFGGIAKLTRDTDVAGRGVPRQRRRAGASRLLIVVLSCIGSAVLAGGTGDFGDALVPCATTRAAPRSPCSAGLAWVNAGLFVFNLIPAFPLDGGASPARSRGRSPATATAARASPRASGQAFSYILMGLASSCSSAATRAAGSGGSSWAGSWASRRPARSSRAASPSAWRA